MFGKCKVCEEKDKRIRELKEQVVHLRSLTYPSQDFYTNTSDAFADDIKEVVQQPIDQELSDIQQEHDRQAREILSERDRLLSGEY